jgi:hypothetical protein
MFNIPLSMGEYVTNKYFDVDTKSRAKKTKIKLVDRDELIYLHNSRNSWKYSSIMFTKVIDISESMGFIEALKYLLVRNLSIDKQIEKYGKAV